MVKQTIQIHLRFRPPDKKKSVLKYDIEEAGGERPRVTLEADRPLIEHTVCNRKEAYRFQFDSVFDVDSGQDQVFDLVSRPVIDQVLSGYNGTVFAYGQTGSGKTFTITGGAEKYSHRGIIPRTIAYIFNHFEKKLDTEFSMKISYLEIYNEHGYDLLDARHDSVTKLEEMPRVSLYEDTETGTLQLKNLSIHIATSIDEALNLLFMGDTNRMIAETPMNEASTRSHCIFTIHIIARPHGSAKFRKSKLHLVDLAGSERVYKSGIDGSVLMEAKYINLSLHYLEQVIVALADKQRTHVPYRNSMMTMVLRDSLGGNCLTSMIATCSVEQSNLQETISTCRFAQRVALIKNDVVLNEELDPRMTINRLKQEVDRLKAELALATGIERDEELTEEEKERCTYWVERYLNTSPDDPEGMLPTQVFSDIRKLYFCMRLLQKLYVELKEKEAQSSRMTIQTTIPPLPITTKEVEELRDILAQRDHEIQILVDLLKREKAKQSKRGDITTNKQIHDQRDHIDSSGPGNDLPAETTQAAEHVTDWLEQQAKGRLLGPLSMGRAEAFDLFKRDYHLRGQIEDQKEELRALYMEAKSLGKRMYKAREKAGRLQIKLATAINLDPDDPEQLNSNAMADLRNELESKRDEYHKTYHALKQLKPRIEHLQHALETAKVRLVREFEQWWSNGCPTTSSTHAACSAALQSDSSTLQNRKDSTFVLERNGNSSNNVQLATTNDKIGANNAQPAMVSSDLGNPIPLTGDPVVDADILTFVRAREKIRRRQMQQQGQL